MWVVFIIVIGGLLAFGTAIIVGTAIYVFNPEEGETRVC